MLIPYIIALIIVIFYFPYLESSPRQATIGKQLLGMKVVDLEGKRITFKKAFLRAISCFLNFLTLYVGYLMVAFTKRKQGLHDKIAGTVVVKR
jgi:uncharacterized RDD family membrane protein YckC